MCVYDTKEYLVICVKVQLLMFFLATEGKFPSPHLLSIGKTLALPWYSLSRIAWMIWPMQLCMRQPSWLIRFQKMTSHVLAIRWGPLLIPYLLIAFLAISTRETRIQLHDTSFMNGCIHDARYGRWACGCADLQFNMMQVHINHILCLQLVRYDCN